MDSLELSKIGGVICAALLAYVGLSQVSGGLVAMHELEEPVYAVEIEEEGEGGGEAEAIPLGQLIAAADTEAGAKTFRGKCSSCHNADPGGSHAVGPNLHGVMGNDIAAADGFAYSDALLGIDGDWTWEAMDGFLTKPSSWAKGTKMSFAGFRKETDRANVMAWLNEQSNAPIEPPAE